MNSEEKCISPPNLELNVEDSKEVLVPTATITGEVILITNLAESMEENQSQVTPRLPQFNKSPPKERPRPIKKLTSFNTVLYNVPEVVEKEDAPETLNSVS